MPEASITTYSKDAQRLYERGLAAARGGQRRIAAGMLTKAVQLDPRHEQAWLWLSSVLDDPHDIAFCLHSALKLNPNNAQARKGLEWIAERNALAKAPATPSRLREIQVTRQPGDSGAELAAMQDGRPRVEQPADPASWWQEWRSGVRTQSSLRLATLTGLIILIATTAAFYRLAQAQSPPARSGDAARIPLPPPGVTQQSVLSAAEVNQATILSYLSAVQVVRNRLQQATDSYRTLSTQTTLAPEQIEAARAYRDELRHAYTELERIEPPAVISAFHAEYKQGIELEQSAFDDVLEYYTNYNLAIANRAALRLQEANSHYQRARTGWQAYHAQFATPTVGATSTLR